MKRPTSTFGLKLLIVLGIAIAIAGVVLHLALPARYERVELIPLAVGFALALFGAAWLDPDRAKKAARAVTDAGGEVVHSVTELRMGSRQDGAHLRVETTAPVETPDVPQEVKVTVRQGDFPAPDEPPTGGFPAREGA